MTKSDILVYSRVNLGGYASSRMFYLTLIVWGALFKGCVFFFGDSAGYSFGFFVLAFLAGIFTIGYLIDAAESEFYSPLGLLKIKCSKEFSNFRMLVKLANGYVKLDNWADTLSHSDMMAKQPELNKLKEFIIYGLKYDFLARMKVSLEDDMNVKGISLIDGIKTPEQVRDYIVNGVREQTEMDKIYAELDKSFPLEA